MLADGFYEWQRTSGRKQPYFVGLQSDRPFGLAGLWERWEKHGQPVESCTILTTDANELMQPIHERMPVILPPDAYDLWLALTARTQSSWRSFCGPAPRRGCWPIGSAPWSTIPGTTW